MAYCTGSHTKFYHRYHIVWVTKYRYKVLQGELRERLREIIRQTCSEMGVRIEKGVLSRAIMCICSCRSHRTWRCRR